MNETTKKFIFVHRNDDVRTLALQARRYPDVDMREAVTQIEGWQLAQHKLPQWAACDGVIYPPKISMEQCSSQATALYKASLAGGRTLADLAGGFGIDCSYMAQNFKEAIYIERNSLLCDIAKENFATLGLHHISIINGNSEEILPTLPHCDTIFIDPARRDGDGRKVVALADCTPDVTTLEDALLQKGEKVIIKCSPMLDASAACRELKHVQEVHIVAAGNECKELLLVLSPHSTPTTTTHCVNLLPDGAQTFSFTAQQEQAATATYTSEVGRYLYEPNAAIQKAGCHKSLAQATGAAKLHPNSHLYTSQERIDTFPGRAFKVTGVVGFSKNELKQLTAIKKANITVRNFPESVAQLRKRLKMADGGDTYIFATTLADERKVLVLCGKL